MRWIVIVLVLVCACDHARVCACACAYDRVCVCAYLVFGDCVCVSVDIFVFCTCVCTYSLQSLACCGQFGCQEFLFWMTGPLLHQHHSSPWHTLHFIIKLT